ncbi:MAG: 3',5'-cyclic-nucleotide phosphodiesterase [Archangium sp.]|nr:3',5'-cyclic-nucleotide phosphodiesterase [Archangium sp.]
MRSALAVLLLFTGCAAVHPHARFEAVVLGSSGGLDESDLTSVWLTRFGRQDFIALDAGTVVAGLRRAHARGSMGLPSESLSRLRGVFLSHPHLDHVSGLILASPDLPTLNVYGLAPTLDALATHVFSSPLWANFSDEGPRAIGRFHLERLTPGTAVDVPAADVKVEALELSHADTTSTAFLVFAGEDAVLYLGDTGPDAVEKQGRLAALWKRVAPLVRAGKLKAIFLEASFADPREDSKLFGHLTPGWVCRELVVLGIETGLPSTMTRVTIVITHIKPSLDSAAEVRAKVVEQMKALGAFGITIVVPEPGQRLLF